MQTVNFQCGHCGKLMAVGVGPARSAALPIQAANASLVEHVELNGL